MSDFIDGEDPLVAEVAGSIADGTDLDLSHASQDPSSAGHDLIRELQIVAAVAKALRSAAADEGRSATIDPVSAVANAGAPADVPATSDVPQFWGSLRILGEVGRGSFGRVFRAWEPHLEREVALKLLDAVPAGREDELVAEARLLAHIRHENVVTVFGADRVGSDVGFWMELVEGRTLKTMHEDYGAFSAQEALLIALDVCRALAAVHRAGFVHGDIKAQNVLRQVGGRIVLTDFGAARLIQVSANDRRRTTVTPFYVAPEVLQGAAPSVRSDLYSLGVLLYYLVTGKFPVTGRTVDDFRLAHASSRRTWLRDARPDLPAAFIRVVDRATAALPEERPESAGALEALIDGAMGRASSSTHRGGADTRTGDSAGPSIAVLQFVNLSADPELAYFCEGLAEEVIDALTRIPDLRVVARASAFAFDPHVSKAQNVGTALNVKTVLSGSVRKSGDRLRVSARLTDATSGVQLWSKQFTRDQADVFGVQNEIANAAAGELGVRLGTGLSAATAERPASLDPQAYTLYLKGRYCWNQRSEVALQKSAAYFHAAIEKDPDYGQAYAGLAEAYATLGLYGVLAPHDIMPRARSAASSAIQVAAHLSSPHATTACIAATYEWDWRSAAVHYHRALELNPVDPAAHHWYAINFLVPLGRFEEAAAELRRAAEADPLSMPIRASFGIRSYFAHDFERACRELGDCLEQDAGSGTARLFMGLTLVETGRHDEAIRELETASHVAASPEMQAGLAYAYARSGQAERAHALLDDLLLLSERRYVSPSLVAQVHAGLGHPDLAFEWLQRASEARAVDLAWLGVRPVFDSLRADARVNALVARIHRESAPHSIAAI